MAGKLSLLSLGPGSPQHLTAQALQALQEAEVVVGYKSYLRLIEPLLDGKTVLGSGMRQELQRCADAYQQACAGYRTVLIS
ncbi:MAG: precorrin-3B C(17)-methyltransferase, partial [Magnetococcales bacterium]|nr:precorrin-3B C(17)-methyltransferase [Magnetococcales bacterium]